MKNNKTGWKYLCNGDPIHDFLVWLGHVFICGHYLTRKAKTKYSKLKQNLTK